METALVMTPPWRLVGEGGGKERDGEGEGHEEDEVLDRNAGPEAHKRRGPLGGGLSGKVGVALILGAWGSSVFGPARGRGCGGLAETLPCSSARHLERRSSGPALADPAVESER